MKKNNITISLVFLFVGLLFLYLISMKNGDIFFPLFFIISSTILSFKYKKFNRNDICTGIILGVISMNPIYGFCSIFGYIGAKSVFNQSNIRILAFPSTAMEKRKAIYYIVFGGIALSTINVIWMMLDTKINPSFHIQAIVGGLQAGIPEEILYRYLLFAICTAIAKDKGFTKLQSFLCYSIITIPHVMQHFPLVSEIDIVSFLIMLFAFGIPLAYFQKKSSLFTAIAVHFIIDFISFILFAG